MRDVNLTREAQRAWDEREPRRGPAFWALLITLLFVLAVWGLLWVVLR